MAGAKRQVTNHEKIVQYLHLVQDGKWNLGSQIGKGGNGAVYTVYRFDEKDENITKAIKLITVSARYVNLSEYENQFHSGIISGEEYKKKAWETIYNQFPEMQFMDRLGAKTRHVVKCVDYAFFYHDDDETWNILYLMDLLTPVGEYIYKSKQPEKEILRMWLEMAEALTVCYHDNEVLHLDIKDANIMIDSNGSYVLIDWGTASYRSGIQERIDQGKDVQIGTPSYMAPEVYNKHRYECYDGRADIYSLGLVVYYFFNGSRLPFATKSWKEMTATEQNNVKMYRLTGNMLPRPMNIRDDVWEVIQKSCAFQPNARYANADELYTAVQSLLKSSGSIKPVKPEQKKKDEKPKNLIPVISAVVGVGLLGFVAWMMLKPANEERNNHALSTERSSTATITAVTERAPAESIVPYVTETEKTPEATSAGNESPRTITTPKPGFTESTTVTEEPEVTETPRKTASPEPIVTSTASSSGKEESADTENLRISVIPSESSDTTDTTEPERHTPTPEVTLSSKPTSTPEVTKSPEPTPTHTPRATETPELTPTHTPKATETPKPTPTPIPTAAPPVISGQVFEDMTVITGVAQPGNEILLYFLDNDKNPYAETKYEKIRSTADENGTFSIEVPQMTEGWTLVVETTDSLGNRAITSVTVGGGNRDDIFLQIPGKLENGKVDTEKPVVLNGTGTTDRAITLSVRTTLDGKSEQETKTVTPDSYGVWTYTFEPESLADQATVEVEAGYADGIASERNSRIQFICDGSCSLLLDQMEYTEKDKIITGKADTNAKVTIYGDQNLVVPLQTVTTDSKGVFKLTELSLIPGRTYWIEARDEFEHRSVVETRTSNRKEIKLESKQSKDLKNIVLSGTAEPDTVVRLNFMYFQTDCPVDSKGVFSYELSETSFIEGVNTVTVEYADGLGIEQKATFDFKVVKPTPSPTLAPSPTPVMTVAPPETESEIFENMTEIKGRVHPGDTVTLRFEAEGKNPFENTEYEMIQADVAADGTFTAVIPQITQGWKLIIEAKDILGNVERTEKNVYGDGRASIKLEVADRKSDEKVDLSGMVTIHGTGTAHREITVRFRMSMDGLNWEDALSETVMPNADGTWVLELEPDQLNDKATYEITAAYSDGIAAEQSGWTRMICDGSCELSLENEKISENDSRIAGTTEPDATVTLFLSGDDQNPVQEQKADEEWGYFSFENLSLIPGETYKVIAKDEFEHTATKTIVVEISRAPITLNITKQKTDVETFVMINGTAEPQKAIKVIVNDHATEVTANANGQFSYIPLADVLIEGENIVQTMYSDGLAQSSNAMMTIAIDNTPPALEIDQIVEEEGIENGIQISSTELTGKTDPDINVTMVTQDDEPVTVLSDADGNFRFDLKELGVGDGIWITAQDAENNRALLALTVVDEIRDVYLVVINPQESQEIIADDFGFRVRFVSTAIPDIYYVVEDAEGNVAASDVIPKEDLKELKEKPVEDLLKKYKNHLDMSYQGYEYKKPQMGIELPLGDSTVRFYTTDTEGNERLLAEQNFISIASADIDDETRKKNEGGETSEARTAANIDLPENKWIVQSEYAFGFDEQTTTSYSPKQVWFSGWYVAEKNERMQFEYIIDGERYTTAQLLKNGVTPTYKTNLTRKLSDEILSALNNKSYANNKTNKAGYVLSLDVSGFLADGEHTFQAILKQQNDRVYLPEMTITINSDINRTTGLPNKMVQAWREQSKEDN